MAATVPDEMRRATSGAARLGTATHGLVEHCLKKDVAPATMENRIIVVIEKDGEEGHTILKPGAKMPKAEPDYHPFIVDVDMIEDADVCVDYVRERCLELGVKLKDLQLETRTNPLPERGDTSGTADITIPALLEEMLEVVDYKNGYLEVEHEDNDQAQAYLLGKAIDFDWAFTRYKTTICQPNFPHAEGAVRSADYTADELKEYQKGYEASIKKCERAEKNADTNAPEWQAKYLKAGDWCTFCDAGAICPARRKEAERLARIEFGVEPAKINLPVPSSGRAEAEVANILRWAPFLDQLVQAATLYAHRALEAGYDIPGFKLVKKRSKRKLIEGDPQTIARNIVDAGYVAKTDLLFERKMKSGPAIEKLIPKGKRKAFNDDFLTKPDAGTAVARIEDVRSSVQPRAIIDDFEPMDDEPTESDFG